MLIMIFSILIVILFLSENSINNPLPNQIPQTPQLKALNELNELGRNLMEKSLNDPATPLNVAVIDFIKRNSATTTAAAAKAVVKRNPAIEVKQSNEHHQLEYE